LKPLSRFRFHHGFYYRLLKVFLPGALFCWCLLTGREEVDSSTLAIYDVDIARGAFIMELPNDSMKYIEDAIVFQHSDGNFYTVRYKISTEKLSHRIHQNTDKNIPRIAGRSWTDVEVMSKKLKHFAEVYGLRADDFIMGFVQSGIHYRSDNFFDVTYPRPYHDYHKYAIETIFDKFGDCEDKVILAAALLGAAGYDVGYVEIPRHILLAIHGDYKGHYFFHDQEKYYLWETTLSRHAVGEERMENLEAPTFTRLERMAFAKMDNDYLISQFEKAEKR